MTVVSGWQWYFQVPNPGTWCTPNLRLCRGVGTLEILPMIPVWQVEIVNTQGFEEYFSLMVLELADFSTETGVDALPRFCTHCDFMVAMIDRSGGVNSAQGRAGDAGGDY